jgi:hypothetical protein
MFATYVKYLGALISVDCDVPVAGDTGCIRTDLKRGVYAGGGISNRLHAIRETE